MILLHIAPRLWLADPLATRLRHSPLTLSIFAKPTLPHPPTLPCHHPLKSTSNDQRSTDKVIFKTKIWILLHVCRFRGVPIPLATPLSPLLVSVGSPFAAPLEAYFGSPLCVDVRGIFSDLSLISDSRTFGIWSFLAGVKRAASCTPRKGNACLALALSFVGFIIWMHLPLQEIELFLFPFTDGLTLRIRFRLQGQVPTRLLRR